MNKKNFIKLIVRAMDEDIWDVDSAHDTPSDMLDYFVQQFESREVILSEIVKEYCKNLNKQPYTRCFEFYDRANKIFSLAISLFNNPRITAENLIFILEKYIELRDIYGDTFKITPGCVTDSNYVDYSDEGYIPYDDQFCAVGIELIKKFIEKSENSEELKIIEGFIEKNLEKFLVRYISSDSDIYYESDHDVLKVVTFLQRSFPFSDEFIINYSKYLTPWALLKNETIDKSMDVLREIFGNMTETTLRQIAMYLSDGKIDKIPTGDYKRENSELYALEYTLK